jgi:hypothetical protein
MVLIVDGLRMPIAVKNHAGTSETMNPMSATILISIYQKFREVQFGLDGTTCRWYRDRLKIQKITGSITSLQKPKIKVGVHRFRVPFSTLDCIWDAYL